MALWQHRAASATLRRWIAQTYGDDADDAADARDGPVRASANYMRRTPHSMINVLRAEQLAAAETKRKSPEFYASRMRKLLAIGEDELEAALARDRGDAAPGA